MVKKAKTTKKATTAAKKIAQKTKPSPFKSKLGHDPLSWINGADAQELGISFDDIESHTEQKLEQLDHIIPPSASELVSENVSAEIIVSEEIISSSPVLDNDATQGWGLFDDEIIPVQANVSQEEVISDDGSWGLFGDDADNNVTATAQSVCPVGEGIAWGLFGDEAEADPYIDSSAPVIRLPAVFNVAEIDRIYHEFEKLIEQGDDVVVDAKQMEVIDACGLQLLYASQKELQRRNCKLVIKDTSNKIALLSRASFINEVLGING